MLKRFFDAHSSARYVLSSVASWVVDNGLYYLLLWLLGTLLPFGQVGVSTAAQVSARVLSSLFNFNMNKFFVFRSRESYRSAFVKYYCVCIPQTAVSVLIMDVLIGSMHIGSETVMLMLKIAVETVLFVLSYVIQNKWVFRKKTDDPAER